MGLYNNTRTKSRAQLVINKCVCMVHSSNVTRHDIIYQITFKSKTENFRLRRCCLLNDDICKP